MQYKVLTFDDRKMIAKMYLAGLKITDIAKKIGVAPSTLYMELKRGNDGKLDKNLRPSYSAALAQKTIQENLRKRGRKGKLK